MMSIFFFIECVDEPSMHICNMLFKCGVVPYKIKTATVMLVYKSGEKHLLSVDQLITKFKK